MQPESHRALTDNRQGQGGRRSLRFYRPNLNAILEHLVLHGRAELGVRWR